MSRVLGTVRAALTRLGGTGCWYYFSQSGSHSEDILQTRTEVILIFVLKVRFASKVQSFARTRGLEEPLHRLYANDASPRQEGLLRGMLLTRTPPSDISGTTRSRTIPLVFRLIFRASSSLKSRSFQHRAKRLSCLCRA